MGKGTYFLVKTVKYFNGNKKSMSQFVVKSLMLSLVYIYVFLLLYGIRCNDISVNIQSLISNLFE